MSWPSSEGIVATTIWSEPFFSKSASFCVSSTSLAASMMPASSTTRPVSAGKSAASAWKGRRRATTRNATNAARLVLCRAVPEEGGKRGKVTDRDRLATLSAALLGAEIDLRQFQLVFGDREIRQRFIRGVPESRPQHRRERPQWQIVVPDGLDIVAPRHRDAVFGAFKLRLQRQEILIGLEVRIIFHHRQKFRQRAGEAGLALLELLESFGVLQGLGRHRDLRRLGARLDHGLQRVLFVAGIAFDRLDQIGDEVGAALVLVLHFAEGGLGVFLVGRDRVEAAAGKQRQHERHHQESRREAIGTGLNGIGSEHEKVPESGSDRPCLAQTPVEETVRLLTQRERP